ncbi:MAG: ankyrin repeat domain-containing protein, partial [Candidatus Ratteibacteria bacterium]
KMISENNNISKYIINFLDIKSFQIYSLLSKKHLTLLNDHPIYKNLKSKDFINLINYSEIFSIENKDINNYISQKWKLVKKTKNPNFNFLNFLIKINIETNKIFRFYIKNSDNCEIKYLNFLIKKGADIHAKNDYALRLASKNGHLETVKFLIENGANIHADNDYALRWASNNGHSEVVKLLIENGADINVIKN